MNEINLVEILKDAPKGTPLYSTILGECTLDHINGDLIWVLSPKCDVAQAFTKEGYIILKSTWCSEVCCLFPSKHHATWNDFAALWKHKHFKPFQKVLIASGISNIWEPDIYKLYDVKRNIHECMHYYNVRKDSQIIPYKGNEDKLGKPVK